MNKIKQTKEQQAELFNLLILIAKYKRERAGISIIPAINEIMLDIKILLKID